MAAKLQCPRCGKSRVDTRNIREFADGRTFKKRWPLVRFLLWVPVISISSLIGLKAVLITLALAAATAFYAAWRNQRGTAASSPKEIHACRNCGFEWKHAPGEPEPAPFQPPTA